MFNPGPGGKDVEQKIWNKIFNEFHDPFVRPIKRREDKLVVHVGITYHQLIDVVSQLIYWFIEWPFVKLKAIFIDIRTLVTFKTHLKFNVINLEWERSDNNLKYLD